MPWKPEYELNRREKDRQDPARVERRNERQRKVNKTEARKAYMKAYYLAHPEKFNHRTPEQRAKINATRRERYAKDQAWRDAHKATVREWAKANPEIKKSQRLRVFGMTLDQFKDMQAAQGNACAICRKTPPLGRDWPHVDHCHKTGKVRGLLCSQCNMGIGKFHDDPARLRAAARYLSRG